MLHYNAITKVANEKKGMFSFYSHDMNKNSNESISVIDNLMFQLKMLIINKSKDTHNKYE